MRKVYSFLVCALLMFLWIAPQAASAYTNSSYLVRTEASAWQNISGTPMPEMLCSYDYYAEENASNPITCPFNFLLTDRTTNTFRASPAGCIFFDTAAYANVYESSSYGYWFELDYGYYTMYYNYDYMVYNEHIYGPQYMIMPWCGTHYFTPPISWQYATLGSAPNRKFVVESDHEQGWYAGYYGSGGSIANWQVVLSEAGISTIEFNYQIVSPANTSYHWQASGYMVVSGFKTTGYYFYNPSLGTYYYSNGWLSILESSSYNTPGMTPPTSTSSIYDNEYGDVPTVSYRVFIAYPYDLAAQSITYPANQAILLKDVAFTPTGLLGNAGSSQPTGAVIRRQIWAFGDPSPVYVSDLSLLPSGSANVPNTIPPSFTTAPLNFATFAPHVYGIYEDSMFVVSLTPNPPGDQYAANNLSTSEFTVSPPNNIKAVTVLSPAPNSRTPINTPTPISIRFRNIGANGQINIPITAIIKNPAGLVIQRDTLFIPQLLSDSTLDTAFADFTFPTNGNYTVCGIAIMLTDQLRADDTTCATVAVRYADDVAAISVFNPQPQEEKPYTRTFKVTGIFQSVGVSDEFDVPARVQIRRCSDGALVFQADSLIPELNVDKGQVKFSFPSDQGNYHMSKLVPGCYTACVVANYPTDGDPTNDTACTQFSIIDRLKGNIYVGVGQRFQTLTAAVDSMRFRGIGGNLNLILTDANYTENGTFDASSINGALDFGFILGSTDTAVGKFMPKPGVTPTITFTGNKPYCFYFGDAAHYPGYFTFDGNNLLVQTADQILPEPTKRGIKVIDNSTAAGGVFGLEYGGAQHMKIRNMILVGNGMFSNDSSQVIHMFDTASLNTYRFLIVRDTIQNHDNLIDNNTIVNARYGINEIGVPPQFNLGQGAFNNDLRDYNNTISRNKIGDATYGNIGFAGIMFDNTDNLVVKHNEISWVNASLSGAPYAIGIGERGAGNAVGTWIDANKIHNISGGSGQVSGIGLSQSARIYVNGTGPNAAKSTLPTVTKNRVTNNFIYDLRTGTGITVVGGGTAVPLYYQTNSSSYFTDRDSVFNNSISSSNALVGILMSNQTHSFVWDNILQITNTNNAPYTAMLVSVPRPMLSAISSDYNLFDLRQATAGNETFAVAQEYANGTFIQSRTFRRLNDWQTYTGQDIHSQTGDPLFTSDSLHLPGVLSYIPSPASKNAAWLNTTTQWYDFDGNSRNTGNQTPNIGASDVEGFQYANDIGVMSIRTPAGYSATSDTTFVTTQNPLMLEALVKNFGSQISPNRVVTAALDVAISGGAWTRIYTSATTATFNVGETKDMTWTGPTLTAAQIANGVFRVTISANNDQNNANNSQQKVFRVLIKNNATLVTFESTTAFGLTNRDSATAALRRLGVPYDSLDRSQYGSVDLDYTPWWTLVWTSGDPNVPLTPDTKTGVGAVSFKNTEEIERYLAVGQTYAKKSLIMAGQNIALYNDGSNINGNGITDTIFTHQYLHTKFIGTTPVAGGYAGFIKGNQVYFTFRDSINCPSPDVVRPAQVTGTVGNNIGDFAYYYNSHPAIASADSGAGTTWRGATYNVVFYGFDWSCALQTNPSEVGINTSGTTRIMRGALDFVTSFGGTILPVEFVNVAANQEATANKITWEVAHQTDVDHYEVESLVGSTWQTIGRVSADQQQTTYPYLDNNVANGKTYTYRIASVDLSGVRTVSQTVNVTRDVPTDFALGQNYPNPFSPSTVIAYTLPSQATVTLSVIDVTGKVVRTEFTNSQQGAGSHSYTFDANGLASGTYVYQLTATLADGQTTVMSKKMTLSK